MITIANERSVTYTPHVSLVFFFQSSSSPAFLTSLSTQSALASLVSSCPPHVTLPLSSVVCHPPSFLRVMSTVIFSSLVSLSSYCAFSSLPLTPPFSSCLPSLLFLFRTQLFSHTCSLYCGSSESANVSVPYRHACVTQVLVTLPFSLFEIRRTSITPSTALHAFAPACTLRRTSFSLSPHSRLRHLPLLGTRTCPLRQFLPLQLDVQLVPLVAYVQHFRLS